MNTKAVRQLNIVMNVPSLVFEPDDEKSPAGQSLDLQEMLDSLKKNEVRLGQEIDDLKNKCMTIQEDRQKLAGKAKFPYLFLGGAAASFLGLIATCFLPLIVGGAILGVAGMVLSILQHKKEIELDNTIYQKAMECRKKSEERAKVHKMVQEFEVKIAKTKSEVGDMLKSVSRGGSDIVEVNDEFIIIDNVKLPRKMRMLRII